MEYIRTIYMQTIFFPSCNQYQLILEVIIVSYSTLDKEVTELWLQCTSLAVTIQLSSRCYWSYSLCFQHSVTHAF